MTYRDQNGRRVTRSVRRAEDGNGWIATVWFGGFYGFVTDVTTYRYRTRAQARDADISDAPGDGSGRI